MQLSQPEQTKARVITITRESGIPLIGTLAFGIIDRGTNILQVRATSICNMRCRFCSTAANDINMHGTKFLVDVKYLVEEVEKVVKLKGDGVIVFLDSVGEPLCHPEFVQLVEKVKKIKGVKEVIVITNGTLLTEEKVDALKRAGLDRINLSVHALDQKMASNLFGMASYNVERIREMIKYIKKVGIDLMITPVWLPKVNDEEVEKIIVLCKDLKCKIGIQKYEIYKYSRKVKEARVITYWKFRNKLREWEKKYGIPLVMRKEDVHVEKRRRIPEVFEGGEKVNGIVKVPGWYPKQMIAVARGRCITVTNCNAESEDKINMRMTETKNNIYLAEQVRGEKVL